MMNPSEHYDRLHDHMMAIARERDWLQIQVDKWRNIAGNLYDEMRLRGADCLYRHEDATKDCVNDYELADGLAERGDTQ
jgi:hypothetical protein